MILAPPQVACDAVYGHVVRVGDGVAVEKVFGQVVGCCALVNPVYIFADELVAGHVGLQPRVDKGDGLVDELADCLEVGAGVCDEAEVGGINAGKPRIHELLYRLPPGLAVEFRRWRGKIDKIRPRQVDAAGVTDEGDVSQADHMVVAGVPRRVHGHEGQAAGGDRVAIVQGVDAIGGRGEHLPPKGVHLVAVDAGGAGQQAGGIDQVGCADVVDVDGYALLGEPARGAGVVEVDVGDDDGLQVAGLQVALAQMVYEGVPCGAGAGFDQDHAGRSFDQVCGDCLGGVLKSEIECFDVHVEPRQGV